MDPKPKKRSKKGHLEGESSKTQEWPRKWQMASQTNWKCSEKLNTPSTFFQCKLSAFGRIYHVFHKLLSTN
jgi:hypothetical protein